MSFKPDGQRSVVVKMVAAVLSVLYRIGVNFRNFLFDAGFVESRKFKTPVISVGNITVGGTGKTPHTELLLETLRVEMRVAMISRGYKRKTKGFVEADAGSTAEDIGDEPFQMKRKFPDVVVAVDKNRCEAIDNINRNHPEVSVVVLDDGFQHRYVEPGLNILLVDYSRPMHKDKMLPWGELREPAYNKSRANIIIVTKCPAEALPIDYRLITKDLSPRPYQTLYFSSVDYKEIYPLFGGEERTHKSLGETFVLVVSGIKDDVLLVDELKQFADKVESIRLKDHHDYTKSDIEAIAGKFDDMGPCDKIIIVTEKDAAKIVALEDVIPESLRDRIYVQPIGVKILFDKEECFKKQVLDYIKKNTTNNRISGSRQ